LRMLIEWAIEWAIQ